MRRLFWVLIALLLLLGPAPLAKGQAAGGVRVIGRDGQIRLQITDGDQIQLQVRLPAPATESSPVTFHLAGLDGPVAACTVAAGMDACLSAPFPALGWYWLPDQRLTAAVAGVPLPGETAVAVAPRPVVMVHGFISNWEAWQPYLGAEGFLATLGLPGFAVGDGQAPGVLNTGSLTNPAVRTNSIAQNAVILGDYITAVQQQTGAEQVDLLVHSMGGMISRYYLDRVMTSDNVAQLIFLGTPQSGSACVLPVAALGFLLPAALEIQPSYMDGVFNRQIVRRQGVPFHLVAGTRLLEPVTSPCTSVPSDMVVGLDSATSIPLDSVTQIPLTHSDLIASPELFTELVKPLLQAGPEAFAPRTDPPAPAAVAATEQFSRVFTGRIAPGQSQEITIQIDPDVRLASFTLFDSSRSLQVEVRGASGNLLTLDPQANGLLEVDDPEIMIYLGYGFTDPRPGAWVVTVLPTAETPAAGADFALMARYQGGGTLTAQTNPTVPAFGEPVTISARLRAAGQAVTVEAATALLRLPDGRTVTIDLNPGGDTFSTSYTATQSGLHAVELIVSGTTAGGGRIERAAFLSFEVQPAVEEVGQLRRTLLTGLGVGGTLLLLFCCGLAFLAGAVLVLVRRKSQK
jgi:pimeloyl-ACP methyl ester carboxylesterase